jgi:putative phage-type endonuclease
MAADFARVIFLQPEDLVNPRSEWKAFVRRVIGWSDEERRNFLQLQQNTKSWHEARRNFIGASSVCYLTGHSEYCTPRYFIRKLVNYYRTTPEFHDENQGSKFTEHGHRAEPVTNLLVNEFTGLSFQDSGITTNNNWPWFGVSLDGRDGDTIAEYKAPAFKVHTDIPASYCDQMQTQMAIADVSTCVFGSLWTKIEGDAELAIHVVERSQKYWENWVLPKTNEALDAASRLDIDFESKLDIVAPRVNTLHKSVIHISKQKLQAACEAVGVQYPVRND